MCGQNPESVVFATEGLNSRAFAHVPNTNRFVLRVRNDEFVLGVEKCDRHVVEVTSAGVNFPRLGLAHTPQFDLTIITTRDNQGQGGMECGPVDSAVVTLEDVLDDGVSVAKQIGLVRVGALNLLFKRQWLCGRVLFAEACFVNGKQDCPLASGTRFRTRD